MNEKQKVYYTDSVRCMSDSALIYATKHAIENAKWSKDPASHHTRYLDICSSECNRRNISFTMGYGDD